MTETKDRIKLHPSWKNVLEQDLRSSYMVSLRKFLQSELQSGKRIYPPMREVFSALDYCPLDQVRVVIIGQDPYHGENQAQGLSFSVKPGVRPPPSLRNIFQEIQDDLHDSASPKQQFSLDRGCLTSWAAQGVLLLNSVLTVVAGRSGSHQGYGWERFTDQIVNVVNEQREHVVFLLWVVRHKRRELLLIEIDIMCYRHRTRLHSRPSAGSLGAATFRRQIVIFRAEGMNPLIGFE